jgi:hypothetical protein
MLDVAEFDAVAPSQSPALDNNTVVASFGWKLFQLDAAIHCLDESLLGYK